MHRPRRLPNQAESWWAAMLSREEQTATVLLQTESSQGRHQRSVYELFSEMEEKDGHLHAVLQTRGNGLLGLPMAIQPASESAADGRAADLVRDLVAEFPDWDGFLRTLLDALAKGFAAVELCWDYDRLGRLTVVEWIAHRQESFAFSDEGTLLLLSPPFAPPAAAPRGDANDDSRWRAPEPWTPSRVLLPPTSHHPAPEGRFVVHRHGAGARHRHGRGLCQHAYWYYWFKKNDLKFWAIYNEKFGAPTAVATVALGTPEDERLRVLEVLRAIQSDTGAVVPESVRLSLLESSRAGGAVFRDLADFCNDEMSKIVLGATLTSGEGRRAGSLALGAVHDSVRREYLEADARALAATLNTQLVALLTRYNSAEGRPPRIVFDTAPPADLVRQSEVDRALVNLGVPIPIRYFHERYGRPVPRADEEVLRYDDSNLFGYHLRFGILTVNEVRRRLGLPPVPWGEERANSNTTADTANPGGGDSARDGSEFDSDGGDSVARRQENDAANERQSESNAEREPKEA